MGFFNNTAGAFKEFFHSPLLHFREGAKEVVQPIKDIIKDAPSRGLLSAAMSNALPLSLMTLLTAHQAAGMLGDDPDKDSMGTAESVARRGAGLWSLGAMMSPKMFHQYNVLPTIIGSVAAMPIVEAGAGMAGKLVDKIIGTSPSDEDRFQMFGKRINDEVTGIKNNNPDFAPGVDDQTLGNMAVKKFMREHPGYDLSFLDQKTASKRDLLDVLLHS